MGAKTIKQGPGHPTISFFSSFLCCLLPDSNPAIPHEWHDLDLSRMGQSCPYHFLREWCVLFFTWFCVAMHLVQRMQKWRRALHTWNRGWASLVAPKFCNSLGLTLRSALLPSEVTSIIATNSSVVPEGTYRYHTAYWLLSYSFGTSPYIGLDHWGACKWHLELEGGGKCSEFAVACKAEKLQHFSAPGIKCTFLCSWWQMSPVKGSLYMATC